MLEPVANIKTMLKQLTNKLLSKGYRRAKLVSAVKKFYGRYHDLVDPTMWPFLNLFRFDCLSRSIVEAFKYRIYSFTDLFHGYMDMVGAL